MTLEQKTTYQVSAITEPTQDLSPVLQVLDSEDSLAIEKLQEELADNWRKKQIFRTETEMRVSVLNDVKHPTPASKYWQSVREMSAHFNALVDASFRIKRNQINKLRLERELQEAIDDGDDLTELELRVDLEENLFTAACLKEEARDRVREIKLWSKIKGELDNGTFDTQDVNSHQAKSFGLLFENRVKALTPSSQPAEIMNATGLHQTIKRLATEDGNLLNYNNEKILPPEKEYKLLK